MELAEVVIPLACKLTQPLCGAVNVTAPSWPEAPMLRLTPPPLTVALLLLTTLDVLTPLGNTMTGVALVLKP